jgi:outer membrane protein assembly factor BamB
MYAWRGPLQSGASVEHYTNGKLDPTPVWTRATHGRGTPVIVDGKVFTFGYRGEREELIEHLACLDANTGKQLWEIEYKDFISDTVYNRYSIGSPCGSRDEAVYLSAYGGSRRRLQRQGTLASRSWRNRSHDLLNSAPIIEAISDRPGTANWRHGCGNRLTLRLSGDHLGQHTWEIPPKTVRLTPV